ncbi:Protein neuralized [Gossypium australe]|uniref:Protein neuralized n=1 Tax=Gossypium australe TaxID=47621 RepID=A0A5B6UG56_9ROSI|nr:Protein neuralized [Gossypium australe]
MAIAGLHNVSVLENSFPRESQSQPSRSRRRENGSTRASSILQMWRELEDEHVVSHAQERGSKRMLQKRTDDLSMTDSDSQNDEHIVVSEDMSTSVNEFGQWSQDRFRSRSGNADSSYFNCEHSSDLGEVERERVRQIFREWMNSGGRERTSNVSRRNNSSRAQLLGETEQERIRPIRECVQMNSQQRGACIQSREEQAADAGVGIEHVLDGLEINQNEDRTEHVHRGIRKLCGRQALLDMLKKAAGERQTEVQWLLELRAVSNFAHRKRIQSLLRGRFLRNDRRVAGDKSTSIAASELGLLRQKQTVSGLRKFTKMIIELDNKEGFFSRLDNSGCGPASSKYCDTPSNSDTKGNRTEQNRVDDSNEVIDILNGQSERENKETDNQSVLDGITDLVADVVEDVSWQDQSGDVTGQVLDGDWKETNASESSLETSQNEARENCNIKEVGEASHEHFPQDGESGTFGFINVVENLEQNLVQYIDGQESASQVEQLQEDDQENEDAVWQEASVEYNVSMDGHNEEASGMHHEDGGNDDGSLLETTRNWLQWSYDQEPGGRADAFYFPEDNVESMELRELRSVSTLLHSGFRESLDQLMQSIRERRNHLYIDLELNETSATPASVEQDVEQQSMAQSEGQGDAEVPPLALPSPRMPYTPASVEQYIEWHTRDRNEGQGDVEVPPLALPSPRMTYMQPLWEQDSYHYNWVPHDVHQQFGINRVANLVQEWDIINDLRFDMARLQQRMNGMQRMLGACMEMQLDLQRSIRQEVSAALNRSAGSRGMIDDSSSKDAHNWDNVRKGLCCICSKGNIDSLLYRCGHMCACFKCGNELVQSGAKCPMCRAPVIEVVRAYSIQ